MKWDARKRKESWERGVWYVVDDGVVAEYRCLPKCLGRARTLIIVATPTFSMFRIQASAPKSCTMTFPNLFVSLPGPPFTVVRSSLHHVITTLDETIHTCQTSPRSTTPTAPDPCWKTGGSSSCKVETPHSPVVPLFSVHPSGSEE